MPIANGNGNGCSRSANAGEIPRRGAKAVTTLIQVWCKGMGHEDLNTTMIYTHVLNRGPMGVCSPADIP